MKKLILLFTIGFLFYGCSKDDSQTTEEQQAEIVQGGDIFLSQVVIINSENINLEEYSATLGELNIKALKSSDNEIMFLVPSNFDIGETIFEISELDIKINYEIKQPVLLETVEETIQPFIDNISSIETDITNEPDSFRKQNVLNAIALFDERMANATDEEKLRLAEFYQINKTLIDEIYTTDYTTVLSRDYGGLGDSEAFNNFAVSVGKALAFSGLSYLSFSIPSPDLFTKLLALGTAVVAIKAWYDAYDLFYECRSRKIFTLDFQIGNIQSSLSGNNNNFIEYYHNTEQENAILRLAQELDESNSNSTITNVSNFFVNLNVLDNIIGKVNFVINEINQYNPFSQIENIPDAILNNATVTSETAEDNLLNTISYSVSNSNVQVDYIQFDNGNMKTKLSIIDQNAVSGEFIETNLNFTYQDDFNDISGSYPIKVFKESQIDLTGNWIIGESNQAFPCVNTDLGATYTEYQLCPDNIVIGTSQFNLGTIYDFYFNANNEIEYTVSGFGPNIIGSYNLNNGTLQFSINFSSSFDLTMDFNGTYDPNSNSFTGNLTYEQTTFQPGSICVNGDPNVTLIEGVSNFSGTVTLYNGCN